MKKILIFFVLVTVVFGLYSEKNLVWCKKILFNEPTKHVIQKGDFFSKLSKQYYGSADFWRELALINRAPNKNLVFPGEEVIIPSLDAVKKLRKTRMLSVVNDIVKNQNDWIAKNGNITTNYAFETEKPELKRQELPSQEADVEPAKEASTIGIPEQQPGTFESTPIPMLEEKAEKSSALPILLTILAIGLVVGAMSFYLYRRKKQYDMEAFESSVEKDEDVTIVDEDEDLDEVYANPFQQDEQAQERVREDALVN